MSNRALTLMMGVVAFLILVVGVVFIVVVVASGGDDGDSPSNPNNPGSENTPRASSGGNICEGKTLYTFGADPASLLDPIQVRDEGTAEYVLEIFGGLVTLGTDLTVQPDLATEWSVSDDGRTYTFTLNERAVFHNGTRVTAQDVKYSIERAADPANNSPTVRLYLGDIVGIDEKYSGSANEVSGVRVIDERTIEIEIEEPISFFLAQLTYPVAFVVDQRQIESDPRNWTRQPNGTGPFRLAEFRPAERIRLVKNDRYHLGAPKLDEVIFELAGGSIVTRYQNNELHIGLVPGLDIEAVKSGSSELAADYRPRSRMAISYIAFNLNQPPFDDINVRHSRSALTGSGSTRCSCSIRNAWPTASCHQRHRATPKT
jgi:oligopeptide transport system substrate-binding protein